MGASEPRRATEEAWRAGRLAALFVVDVANISREGRDVLEPIILTAILQGNQAAARSGRYGPLPPAPVPDELRRPIRVLALAASLRLPFETVRRRIGALQARGLCQVGPDGVIVGKAVVTSPGYRRVQAKRLARLDTFLRELGHEPIGHLPVIAADRALGDYMLRAAETVSKVCGDVAGGIVWLGLFSSTTADARRPGRISAAALARLLSLPGETTRRRLRDLQARGLAQRDAAGWAPSAPAQGLPELLEGNLRDIRRLAADARGAPVGAIRAG